MLGYGILGELIPGDIAAPAVKSISLPKVTLRVTAAMLGILAGRNINLPKVVISFAPKSPTVLAGRSISLPKVTIALSPRPVAPAAGKHIGLPPIHMTIRHGTVLIRAGKIINLANTFDRTYALGVPGEIVPGAFALGDGDPVTVTYTRPVQLRMTAAQLRLAAGKNIGLPPIRFTLRNGLVEADARGRPISGDIIAS
ncbi:hypothetical protein [Nitrobacter winogradskyi]|uniref:Uncharacterized protein n=2 Tax=Nitrobacter winogradskyi TaxID=913 RepID=A0ACC6AGY3_NITWI|nr:hypothetical protein [Nitrobacter winogradskyi]MCP1998768.1 hypothetical protein [Nitrobacter winogradskyi]GEC14307.1 hypothetical protein NWI01_01990 [Nitrobacter winogradskyi]